MKKPPQNNPIDALTKRLSHEFRNKIERPRAMRISPFVRSRRSADEFEDTDVLAGIVTRLQETDNQGRLAACLLTAAKSRRRLNVRDSPKMRFRQSRL